MHVHVHHTYMYMYVHIMIGQSLETSCLMFCCLFVFLTATLEMMNMALEGRVGMHTVRMYVHVHIHVYMYTWC